MVAAVAHHVEIRVAARFGHTEYQIQILAPLFHFHGVLHILGGAQRAGDIQIHHSIIGAGIFFFHTAQAVLKHSHFGHRIAAQCLAAGQKYHLGIFFGHQLGQKIAVGVQADIHLQIRPCLAKQPGCRKGVIHQRLFAKGFQIFVLKPLAARPAANRDKKFFHIKVPAFLVVFSLQAGPRARAKSRSLPGLLGVPRPA